MMSRQRRRFLLMVSASLLIIMFTSVQFQAQRLLPPPPAPGETLTVEPVVALDENALRVPVLRDTELLQNGSFEIAGATNKEAANWKGINLLSSSGRICNRIGHPTKPDLIVAQDGNCAFRFSAQITNVKRQIKQVAATVGAPNDTLQMSYWAAGTDLTNKPRAQVTVTYTDNTKKKLNVAAPIGSYGYTQFSGGISLAKTPKRIVVKFIVVGSGKLYIDAASLRHEFFEYAPTAVDDSLIAVTGTSAVAGNVAGNDILANPNATVTTFGGGSLGGAVTDNAAGATVAIPASGGITVSVAANGAVSVDATAGTAITGTYTFDYQLANTAGSDTATVTLNVQSSPVAAADTFTMLIQGSLNGDLNNDNGSGADSMGVPAATVTSFGGGSLGGAVTDHVTPAAATLAGGTLTVNPDGTFSLVNPLQAGSFTFSYRLSNAAGFSDATVTINVNKAPVAVDDGPYNVNVNTTLNITTAGNDLLDNDDRGFPLATLVGFGLITAADRAPGMSESVAGGTLVVNADGSFTLTNPTITGTYTFHYAINNGIGSDTATVTISVRRPPTAENDAFNMLVNATLNGNLTANNGSGIDIPGTPPFNSLHFGGGDLGGGVTSNIAPASVALAGGTITINADGTFSLVNPTQTGIFTFTYRLTNAIPAFDNATVTIEIRRAPAAVDDGVYIVGTGQTLTVTTAGSNDLLDNDNRGFPLATISTFGGGNVSFNVTDLPAGGTANNFAGGNLTVNANGSFTLTNPTTQGTYTFLYRLSNVSGFSDATVTIQVQLTPDARNDAFNVLLNGNLNGNLTANNGSGADNPGTPAFNTIQFGGGDLGGGVTSNTAPATRAFAGGSLTVNADGTISLTNPTQIGVFSFTYRLTNAIPASDDATVTIEVRKAPTAVDDGTYLVGTGQTLTVTTAGSNDLLDNDDRGYPLALVSHFGGGSLAGTVTANAAGSSTALAGGTLTVNANGSFTLATPSIPGTYTFLYQIINLAGASSATVTIQVQQSPVAEDDNFIVQINTTLNGDLNDDNGSGADSPGVPPYNSLTFGGGSLAGDASTNAAGSTVALAGGNLTVNLDGTFSLVNPTTTGVYTFQYRLSNTIPASDDATVTIDVRSTPVAQDDAGLIAVYSVVTNFPAATLFNDNGSGADFLGVPAATIPSFGTASATQIAFGSPLPFAGGTLTVNTDGSFSIINPTQTGDFTFYYRLQNVSGFDDAQVTVTVQQNPVANDDAFIVQINSTLSDDLNDDNGSGADVLGYPVATVASFGGGSLAGDASTNAAGSTLALAGGNLTVNADGTISLVNPTITGVYTFQYRLSNTIPASDDATVTIDVRATPVAQDDALIAAYGVPNNFPAGTLFADNGSGADFLGVPAATIPSFGTASATQIAFGSPLPFAGGSLTVNADGSFSVNNPTQTGDFTFQYRLQNVSGFDDATVTVTIQRAPVAEDDSFIVQINATLNGDLNDDNGSGADVLGYPVATIASFGGGSLAGDASTNAAGVTVALAGGNLTVNADGTFSLVNPTITGVYTFQYRLSNTIPASDDATVTIDVRATPVAQDDALIATYGVPNNFPAGTLFADNGSGADFLGVPAATIPSFGTASATQIAFGSPLPFAGGTLTVNADGSFSISNPTQTGDFTFYYRLQNVSGFDDATVTVTIQRAPEAFADTFTFLYTANQAAPNSLFAVNGGTADQLGFPAAALTNFGGGALGGTVMTNAAGASVSLAGGSLTVNADGSWSLTGQPFTPGTYTFEYRIENVVGASTATVTLNIQQNPVAVDDLSYTVISGQTLDLLVGNGLLVNDTLGFPQAAVTSYGGGDAGGSVTTYAANTSVNPIPGFTNGMLQINAAGTGVFTPPTLPARFCGEFNFSYRIGNGVASDDADVTITVLCAPDAQNDLFNSGFVTESGGVGLTDSLFADNGSGADILGYEAATLTGFSAIGGGATSNVPGATIALADGTLTVNADGSFTVASVSTPGTYTFDYTITNTAGNDTATVTIVIDEAPRVLNTSTPANGAINVPTTTNVVINFSELVNIAAGGITLECPDNSNITFAPSLPLNNVLTISVNPSADLPGNTVCVVTVVSSLVTDVDTNDAPNNLDGDSDGIEGPDYTSSFTTAPVANDDAYTVTPNLTYDTSAVTPSALSVRNNDDPADTTTITGFGATLATANDTVPDGTNFVTASGAGGRVILNADGTFTFYPDAGDNATSGTAIFHYTITGGDTAQVTLTFEAEELVWFVDDDASDPVCTGTNVGTQACPALTPESALGTAHTASDTIFIAEGAYTCQITLKNSVKVIGDGSSGTTLEAFSGVTPVSGSSFAPYATFTGVDPTLTSGADCFTLGTGNTIRGLTVGTTTGYALVSANAVGTLIVTDVSINGSGGMFSLTNGGTFSGTFNELSSSAHTDAVINLTNIAGTITHSTGSISHANAANPTIRITSGNPTLTYSGSITKTVGGRVIDIQDTTANTITFSGTVAQDVAAGTGIFIDDQTGGTVSFTTINLGSSGTRLTSAAITATDGSGTATVSLGTINLYTSGASAHGLVVTGHDGTLNVTGGSIDANSGGQAINIDGPAGVTTLAVSLSNVTSSGAGSFGVQLADVGGTFAVTTLASISNKTDGLLISNSSAAVTIDELDISSTTTDAVRLSTNTGSFTITGDGAATNTDGAGGTFTSIGDNAFDMTNVQNVTLNDLSITGTGSHAFTGTGVSNLTVDNVDISNIGNADNEHIFNFGTINTANLTGTVSITDSLFSNFTENGLYIENISGSLNLTVSNVEFENNIATTGCGGTNCDGMGILLRADGTASMTVLINSVTFDRVDGIGVSANPEGNSGSFMDIDITNSTFTANTYVTPGNTNNGETAISLRNAQGNGTLKFNVDNNTISQYSGEFALGVIEVEAGDFANTSGFINNNRVHGAPMGEAILLFADGANTNNPVSGTTNFDLIVSVTNNTVNAPVRGANLAVIGNGAISGSDPNAHVTVTGNNFVASSTAPYFRGNLTVEILEFNKVCMNISGNTIANGATGANSIDYYYDLDSTAFLQGMSGTGDANATTRLTSTNTLANSASVSGDDTITSASCTLPTP